MSAQQPTFEHIKRALEADRETAAELLMRLISMRSVTGEEGPIQDFLRDAFTQLGLEVIEAPLPESLREDPEFSSPEAVKNYQGRHNLIVRMRGTGGGHSLILSTHVDTVPEAGWAEAFTPRREGEAIIGRGAVDAKGMVATIWLALKTLIESGFQPRGDLSVHLVIEEEIGGNGALALLRQGERAEVALVVEPTGVQIHPGHRGAIWFRITVQGRSTHMGRKWEGVNAVEKAMRIIEALLEYEKRLVAESRGQPLFARYSDPVQVNIGMLHGGEWPSMVPGEAVIEGGVGFLPNKPMTRVKEEVREVILGIGDEWITDHFTLEFPKLHNDAYEDDPAHPFVTTLKRCCDELGLNSEVHGWNVSCDARLYHHQGQMPTVIFGPGDPAACHSAQEQCHLGDLIRGAEALAMVIREWCG